MEESIDMINKILFIQPFLIEKGLHDLDDTQIINCLPWAIQLENFVKSRIPNIKTGLLYLPIERRAGRIAIDSYSDIKRFSDQMDKLIPKIDFRIDKHTIIGISCTTSYDFLSTKLISEYVKKQFGTSIIVVGGKHATARPDDFKYEGSPIDYIIGGEGEIGFYDLVKNNAKKQEIPHFIKSPSIRKLDDLPLTDFSLFAPYMHHFKRIGVSLSRGCPFNCVFCMEKKLREYNGNLRHWRVFSPKRAVLEIDNMIKNGLENNIDRFWFADPTFGFSKKWLNEVLELYSFEGASEIWVESRIDIMNEELIKRLYSKNFFLMYGLETFSERMLKVINKTHNPNQFMKAFENARQVHKEIGKPYVLNMIFNHPGEDKESFDLSFNKLLQINTDDEEDIMLYNTSTYHSFPGTVAYDNVEFFKNKYGTVLYFPEWWKYEEQSRFGSSMVRPSWDLSLRESVDRYLNAFIALQKTTLEKLRKFRPDNHFLRALSIKKRINETISVKLEIDNFIENEI